MQAVKNTIAENLGVPGAHKLAPKEQRFSLDDVPDQSGKIAVVTGGSEGIGYGCTHTLLAHGVAKVYVLSLSEEIITRAKKAFAEDDALPAGASDRVVWKQCDLSDWARVQAVAREISSDAPHIDIVINNAAKGIMSYALDAHGVDSHFSMNHLGHAVLLDTLLPKLLETADGGRTVRVVALSSNLAGQAPADTQFESLAEINRDVGAQPLYGRSKLANLLHMRLMQARLGAQHPRILFNAVHPGVVNTRQTNEWIHEPFPILGYGMNLLTPVKKDIFHGCVSAMYAATAADEGGQFICAPAIPEDGPEKSQDLQMQQRLWQLTRSILKDKGGIDLSM